MKLYIKYMVSLRCKMQVNGAFEKLVLDYTHISKMFSEVKDITIAHKI